MPDRENAGVRAFLRSYLKPGMIVLDVGANVGDISAVAADCVTPTGRVIAFEPGPDNAELLRKRFAQMKHVEIRPIAVSDHAGNLALHLDTKSVKRHSLFASAVSVRGEAITVPALKLDDLRRDIPRVDFLKIDAQGAEARILAGARALLERDRPVILFELWPYGLVAAGTLPDDLFALLDALRYRCVRLSVKGAQKSRPSIDRFLADATKWASANVIAWPPPAPPTLFHRVQRVLRRR